MTVGTTRVSRTFFTVAAGVAACLMAAGPAYAETGNKGKTESEQPFPGAKDQWHGYDRYEFEVDGRMCYVVVPEHIAPGKPWIWRARFFDLWPKVDLALVDAGFHLAYMDTAGMFGSPQAVEHWNAFYKYLTAEHGFAEKVVLECMGQGGFIAHNWAAANTDKVACIYGDSPMVNYKSWPAGIRSISPDEAAWEMMIDAYGFESEREAFAYKEGTIELSKELGRANTPILHVCRSGHPTAPLPYNTHVLYGKYDRYGGTRFRVIVVKKGDPTDHGLEDPTPIIDFITEHTNIISGSVKVKDENEQRSKPADTPSGEEPDKTGEDKQNTDSKPDEEQQRDKPGEKAQVREKAATAADVNDLASWEITDFIEPGEVRREDGKTILEKGNDLTGITWKGPAPRTNYEITLDAMRVEGSDFFCGLTFPVGENCCSLICGGWGGTVTGISSLDYNDAYNNETARFIEYENGRWYPIRLRVTGGKIEAWIDGEKKVNVDTEGRHVDVRWEVEESKPLGIATWRTTGAVRNFNLREL